jgi:hypothetical protein
MIFDPSCDLELIEKNQRENFDNSAQSNSHTSSVTKAVHSILNNCDLKIIETDELPNITPEDSKELETLWKKEMNEIKIGRKDEKDECCVIQPAIWSIVKQMCERYYPHHNFIVRGTKRFDSSYSTVKENTIQTVKRSRVYFPYSGIPDVEVVEETINNIFVKEFEEKAKEGNTKKRKKQTKQEDTAIKRVTRSQSTSAVKNSFQENKKTTGGNTNQTQLVEQKKRKDRNNPTTETEIGTVNRRVTRSQRMKSDGREISDEFISPSSIGPSVKVKTAIPEKHNPKKQKGTVN